MPTLSLQYNNRELVFETDSHLFSPEHIDRGTLAMLSEVTFEPGMKVLDLGCGYGVVGVCASSVVGPEHVVMTDVSEKAVDLSRLNMRRNYPQVIFSVTETSSVPALSGSTAQETMPVISNIDNNIFVSNGLSGIPDKDFDIILSNPPYHTDFSVAKEFIEDGFKALKTGGRMYMVTKRRTWYENKLKSVFGGVRVFEKDDYFVFVSEKRTRKPQPVSESKNGMSKKLRRKTQQRSRLH